MVELLYAAREYAPVDKLAALAWNPYPARYNTVPFVEHLPNGEVRRGNVPSATQISCGHNPMLFARIVDNLRLREPDDPDAGLIWDERPQQDIVIRH
jgi:hypothetical protein